MLNFDMKYLDWDSQQLGVDCGLIDLTVSGHLSGPDVLVNPIRDLIETNSDIEFITIKLPADCMKTAGALITSGALLMDTELTFFVSPGRTMEVSSHMDNLRIEFCGETDCAPFLSLADEMRLSRFFRDPGISPEKALRLWQTSIRNHCEGLADELAIAYCNDEPCGMVAMKFTGGRRVNLHIVGVLRGFRGRKIGQSMLEKITEKYSGDHEICVETQANNVIAQTVYQKAGFRYKGLKYILHYWRNVPEVSC